MPEIPIQHRRPEQSCPSLMELAEYVDRPGDSNSQWVGSHLQGCTICAELTSDLSADRNEADGLTFVPSHVLERAMALVPEKAHRDALRRRSISFMMMGRAAAAAAVIAVCVAGYQLGSQLNEPQETDDPIASALSFDLFDSSDDGDGELFAMSTNIDLMTNREGSQ